MITIAHYNPVNGQILSSSIIDDASLAYQTGSFIQVDDYNPRLDSTHYVSEGTVAERPACPAQLDGLTLVDLPVPCTIIINGKEYECNDTTAELSFNLPSKYSIMVRAFPYLDGVFEYEN